MIITSMVIRYNYVMIISSWNIESRLSDIGSKSRGSSNDIIKFISLINSDIILLLEAHHEISLNKKISQRLVELGYKLFSVSYDDDMEFRSDSIESRSSLMLLSKLPIKKFEVIRLGNVRNALSAIAYDEMTEKEIRLIGIHLDDRSEITRVKQTRDLINIINSSSLPTILLGDFNAMHGEDLWPAKFLKTRTMKIISNFVLPNLSSKAIEMASGKTLKLIESNTDLLDSDLCHRPTATPKMRGHQWLPSIRLIQIDHIYTSKSIIIKGFKVHKDGGSDHRAISIII